MATPEDSPEQAKALRDDIAEFYPDRVSLNYAPATLCCFRMMLKSNPASRYWSLQLVTA